MHLCLSILSTLVSRSRLGPKQTLPPVPWYSTRAPHCSGATRAPHTQLVCLLANIAGPGTRGLNERRSVRFEAVRVSLDQVSPQLRHTGQSNEPNAPQRARRAAVSMPCAGRAFVHGASRTRLISSCASSIFWFAIWHLSAISRSLAIAL
jgi:hypothetical protein